MFIFVLAVNISGKFNLTNFFHNERRKLLHLSPGGYFVTFHFIVCPISREAGIQHLTPPVYFRILRLVSQINYGGMGFRTGVYIPREFWTTGAILEVCSFCCFTKLKPKSFVTGPFIRFGMSPWLLGTDSGGTHPSRIPY